MKMANTTSFGRLKHNTIRNKNTAESDRLATLGGELFTHILYHKISKKSSLVFAILLCYNL